MASSRARADIAAELLKRRAIRANFGTWCEAVLAPQGMRPARHHRFLIDELQAVADGRVKRLMISLPPGSAKSTYASQLFPAWLMARGNINVLGASHTVTLAERFSGKVQGLIRDNASLLGMGLSTEAKDLWATTNGCEYRAAGVGVGIAGFRSDFGLIDDATKSREDADSETIQGKIFDWYAADFSSRLRPGGAIVLVGTRWAEADLQGRLLETERDRWRVINIPALAETDDPLGRAPGEPLWSDDDYHYGDTLKDIRDFYTRTGQIRDWVSLYQGKPAPEEGSYFRRDWLRPSPSLPMQSTLRFYGASDFAVSDGRGDYTVHVVVGVDPDGRLWLCDLWRGQTSSDVWINSLCDMIKRWKPIGWAFESGQINGALGPFMRQQMRAQKAYIVTETFPTRGEIGRAHV